MTNLDVHFSSAKEDWGTPQEFFDKLNEEFNFTLDPCSSHSNHKCKKYFTQEDDGLSKRWSPHIVFMNPPYGNVLKNWIKKAYIESKKGATVVCLIPARTDTQYWHDYCMRAHEIRLVKGRIKFVSDTISNSAPFPSAVVVFKPGKANTPKLKVMTNK